MCESILARKKLSTVDMQGCSCVWLEELCRGGCKMKYSVQNSIHCWCCWIFISKALQNKYWFTFEGWTGFELCKSNVIIPSCSSRIGQTYGKKIANNCYAWLNNGWVRKLVCKNIILVASFNIPLLEAPISVISSHNWLAFEVPVEQFFAVS